MPQPYQSNLAGGSVLGAWGDMGLGDELVQQSEDENEELRRKAVAQKAQQQGSPPIGQQNPISNAAMMIFGGST